MKAKSIPTKPAPAPRPTILLVDDELSVREMVGRVLTEEGYFVLCACDGVEAVSIAETNQIELVILDLQMPRQGGWDTYEQFTRKYPLVPIMIVTARPNQLFTAVGAGVGALLEKPFDIPTLLDNIKRLLTESEETRLARLAGEEKVFHYAAAHPAV